MKHRRITVSLVLALGAMSAVACGGGDGDGAGTSIEASKPLSDLNASETEELCEYGESVISKEDTDIVGCRVLALYFTDSPEACEESYAACLADDSQEEEEFDCSLTEEDLPACAAEVTVGELEACMEAQASQLATFADEVTCSSDPAQLAALGLPPECVAVEEKCPELFEDDDE